MPLTTLHPLRGATTISNEYLAALFTPNDLQGGVDNIRIVFDDIGKKTWHHWIKSGDVKSFSTWWNQQFIANKKSKLKKVNFYAIKFGTDEIIEWVILNNKINKLKKMGKGEWVTWLICIGENIIGDKTKKALYDSADPDALAAWSLIKGFPDALDIAIKRNASTWPEDEIQLSRFISHMTPSYNFNSMFFYYKRNRLIGLNKSRREFIFKSTNSNKKAVDFIKQYIRSLHINDTKEPTFQLEYNLFIDCLNKIKKEDLISQQQIIWSYLNTRFNISGELLKESSLFYDVFKKLVLAGLDIEDENMPLHYSIKRNLIHFNNKEIKSMSIKSQLIEISKKDKNAANNLKYFFADIEKEQLNQQIDSDIKKQKTRI